VDQEAVALRVLAHFNPGEAHREQVAKESEWLDVRWVDETDDEAFARELPEADVLWHVLRPVTGAELEQATKLKLVQKLGAGVNTIDVDTATTRGIAVSNIPGANAPSVAEGTVLLMLAALRRLRELDSATRAGTGWPIDYSLGDKVRDLGSCTVGLIGYGNVAKRVEQIVRSMDAHVLHTSAHRDDISPSWVSLNELITKSDVISLHLPLTPETENMVNAELLAKMKPGTILINTARGGVIDEKALVDALTSGQLAAAGLDVFAEEPVSPDNPLLALDNVVLSPHVSWLTADTMTRYLTSAIKNAQRVHDGKAPYTVVNQAALATT
jgi:phosphoglycerate dehydrogenase-like enzyme